MTPTATENAPPKAMAHTPFLIPLAQIRESKTNPRTHFDKTKLDELTDSVRKVGVLQPILVRPLASGYEVVAGARRLRAAKAAKLDAIPAVVRTLADEDVLELQMIENLQRDDLHPMEEARGYVKLVREFKHTAEQIAAKVGKSRSYVFGRMKLFELSKGAAELFEAGQLDASTALLVARIPVPALADEAAKRIAGDDNHPAMAYREAARFVQQHYMTALKTAPFPTDDAKLVPAAGACKDCPKRTGNAKLLFPDVAGADVCTDPKCFAAKSDAEWDRRKAKAKKAGVKVVEGDKYVERVHSMTDECFDDEKGRTWKALTKGQDVPKTLVRQHGEIMEVVARADAIAAAKKNGFKLNGGGGGQNVVNAAREKDQTNLRKRVVAAVLPELVVKALDVDETVFLELVASRVLAHNDGDGQIAKRRGAKPDTDLVKACGNRPQLRGLIVEALCHLTGRPHGYRDNYGEDFEAACRAMRVDLGARAAKVAAELKAKKAAKPRAARAATKVG